jgi:nitrate/nitrite transporter NarK
MLTCSKRIQWIGFLLVGAVFIIMSAALTPLEDNAKGARPVSRFWGLGYRISLHCSKATSSAAAFVILYGLSYMFSNAGPNLSTYVIPAEAYPTVGRGSRGGREEGGHQPGLPSCVIIQAIKATCHGFSAAMGKTGAVLGTSIFNPLQQAFGPSHESGTGLQLVLYVCAACSLLGAVWTWAFTVETRDHSIEALDAGHRDGDVGKLGVAEGGDDDYRALLTA